jgi:hypothetical protein
VADVTLYRDPALVNIVLKDGDPPADQTAQVAQLTTDLAAANVKIDAYKAFALGVSTRAQARKDADAAKVDGQDDLDAAANLPS